MTARRSSSVNAIAIYAFCLGCMQARPLDVQKDMKPVVDFLFDKKVCHVCIRCLHGNRALVRRDVLTNLLLARRLQTETSSRQAPHALDVGIHEMAVGRGTAEHSACVCSACRLFRDTHPC